MSRLVTLSLAAVTVVIAPLVALAGAEASTPQREAPAAAAAGHHRATSLRVTTLVSGLSHPWDVAEIGQGRLLVTQREPAALTVVKNGHQRDVAFPTRKIWTSSETGLMGLEVDPGYARNHRFYTCSGWNTSTSRGHDVRVNAWRMNGAATRAHLIKPLVTGFPTTSGRHGGCRLLITGNGSLLVGTGDAADGVNPENKSSLGGKTLRLNRFSGRPWPTNPFVHSADHARRYVQTYGHRNVQGLAERKDGSLWSIEQGTYRDDEVNKLVNGGDYGYNPVPGYNESVPMTDRSLPGHQVAARWSSGDPTIATSGGSFVYGRQWGGLNGTLAVAALKDERIVFLRFDSHGRLQHERAPRALQKYGRLRTVVQLSDGRLLIPTDGDGEGQSRILVVRPR